MTKYLLALVAVVGLGTIACGGDDCTDAADRILAKTQQCFPTTSTSTSTSTSSNGECTDANAKVLQAQAKCIEAASCDALTGKDQAGATTYATCTADASKT